MLKSLVKNKKDIIKKYVIRDDMIYVFYLNGKMEKFEYTPEKLEEINSMMLGQAYIIIDNFNNDFIMDKIENNYFIFSLAGMALGLDMMRNVILYQENSIPVVTLQAAALVLMYILTEVHNKDIAKKLREKYEKYKLFMHRYYSYKKYSNNDELYKGIKYYESIGPLSINTIDSYSYDELAQMQLNLFALQDKEGRSRR